MLVMAAVVLQIVCPGKRKCKVLSGGSYTRQWMVQSLTTPSKKKACCKQVYLIRMHSAEGEGKEFICGKQNSPQKTKWTLRKWKE